MATKKFPPFLQATDWFTIDPDDDVDFVDDDVNNTEAYPLAAIFVGVGGDVAIVSGNDTVKTFKNVANGTTLPVLAKRVNATNTTATNLLGLVGIGIV